DETPTPRSSIDDVASAVRSAAPTPPITPAGRSPSLRAGANHSPPARPAADVRPATATLLSAHAQSRARQTDRICSLGRCVLDALSAPVVAGLSLESVA